MWDKWIELNRNYDDTEEPLRFLIFFGILTNILIGSIFFTKSNFAGVLILIVIGGLRLAYLFKKRK